MDAQWSLIIFTLLICLASGMFCIQGLLAVMGRGEQIQLPSLIVSFVAVVVGGIASFTHLQHWDRAFNGFGHITSGITQELIGIVIMVVVMVIYFAVSRKAGTPKWAGILAIIASLLMVVLMTTSYMMPARPMWATPALYLFYFAQALVSGAAGIWLIGGLVKADGDTNALAARLTAIGGICAAASLAVYAIVAAGVNFSEVGYYFDPTHPTKAMADTSDFLGMLTTGSLALQFWGALIVGGLVCAVLGFIRWKDGSTGAALGTVALVCALAGGLAFRAALYAMGSSVFIFY